MASQARRPFPTLMPYFPVSGTWRAVEGEWIVEEKEGASEGEVKGDDWIRFDGGYWRKVTGIRKTVDGKIILLLDRPVPVTTTRIFSAKIHGTFRDMWMELAEKSKEVKGEDEVDARLVAMGIYGKEEVERWRIGNHSN